MYRIYESELAGNKTIVISHIETGNEASVITDYGGAINSFVVNGKRILRASVTSGDFEKNTVKTFAGVQLFPFPNRVKNARYIFNGTEYHLSQNDDALFPHSLHGLVYNKPFEIASVNETEGKVVLTHHFKADETAYPFEFLLTVEYQLDVNSLQIKTVIHNLSELIAPVGYGWHPYITLSGKVDDCRLQLPATKFYVNDDTLIPDGKTDELKKFTSLVRVDDTELNHCFELPDPANEHQTILEDADGTRIQFDQQGYSFVHCYIPADRKSIAIEPQTCIANAFNNKTGLILMQPGEELNLSFKITVKSSSVK